MITVADVRDALSYDPETGEFVWLYRANASKLINTRHAGKRAGYSQANGYVVIGIGGKLYKAHRLAWVLMTGSFPDGHMDHIDGDPSNNRWSNLRLATRSQNMFNRPGWGQSGLKGVRRTPKGHWAARITVDGDRKCLGTFKTQDQACAAYSAAARRLQGEFARLSP